MGDPVGSPLLVKIDNVADVAPGKAVASSAVATAQPALVEAASNAATAALAGDVAGVRKALSTVAQNADWLVAAAATMKAANEYVEAPVEESAKKHK